MKKSTIIILLIITIILLSTPFIYYISIFGSYEYSKDVSDWAHFGSYLNGTFMPLIAFTGIIVTLILRIISSRIDETKLELDQQKHRPLLHIGYFDAENHLRVFMKNKGNGPLLIEKYRLVNLKTNENKLGIFECLPEIYSIFNNYTGNQENTVLSADQEQEIILFEYNEGKDLDKFNSDLKKIRTSISEYKIVVNYKDVYNKPMPKYERSLEWFNRNHSI
ncbi:hypothetical protein G1K46_00955 [Tenacibaculum finnmarkense]|uniref:hypothetical protein n=1 Tax=Tenacibaculum finnmarkense TaxID=2781243 RepID=UPI00187BC466|nr:hypothetical protein [Tenacibaculum finnmarkense]MBE7647342.1 hypothetical protein [Tenacibaculum finnmarkense genomovar ulcerans]MCG8749345.1 hypothetical protein [Tenacibaculum finnmarkense]MCG8754424.1 hypothetical protein [Tenacibaculum finnmarkense]MCG8761303.1 hypothetical protein [Tenacibaculum finnmarkense]MCG8783120.1 hypothetical protein [Tenacibaculum finnmarkense]